MPKINLDLILLAEDNSDHARNVLKILKEKARVANEIVWVDNGQKAVDYVTKKGEYEDVQTPGLILLDIKMPMMDGLEVLEILKSNSEYKKIPIVMLTTTDTDKEIRRAMELGANSYVVKPVSRAEFIDKVSQIGLYWGIVNQQYR